MDISADLSAAQKPEIDLMALNCCVNLMLDFSAKVSPVIHWKIERSMKLLADSVVEILKVLKPGELPAEIKPDDRLKCACQYGFARELCCWQIYLQGTAA